MTAASGTVGGPEAPSELRTQIIDAAIVLTRMDGWSALTMSRLADQVGVSRQTVYNEVGAKPSLAEAMILRELAGFLAVVDRAFHEHPGEAVPAIRAAVRGVLTMAEGNLLLAAIVASSHGADSDLLPLLTTRSDSLLALATSDVRAHLAQAAAHLARGRRDALADMIVRTVLSHVMQPSGTPARVGDDIAWLAERILRVAPE